MHSNAGNEGTQQFDEPFHARLGTVTPITRLDQFVKKCYARLYNFNGIISTLDDLKS